MTGPEPKVRRTATIWSKKNAQVRDEAVEQINAAVGG